MTWFVLNYSDAAANWLFDFWMHSLLYFSSSFKFWILKMDWKVVNKITWFFSCVQVSATSWKLGYGGGLATRFSNEEMLGSMVEVDLGSSSLAISSIDEPDFLIDGFSRTCLSSSPSSTTASLGRWGSKVNSCWSFSRLELFWLWLSLSWTAVYLKLPKELLNLALRSDYSGDSLRFTGCW